MDTQQIRELISEEQTCKWAKNELKWKEDQKIVRTREVATQLGIKIYSHTDEVEFV